MFRLPGDTLVYRRDEINRFIEARLAKRLSVIVECAVVLRLMAELNRKPDFVIYVSNPELIVTGKYTDEIAAYEAKFSPKTKANIAIEITV